MTLNNKKPSSISLLAASLPLVMMLICLVTASQLLPSIGSEILIAVILLAACVAGIIAKKQGNSWADIQAATGEKLAGVLPALLILLAIGMLIGSWMFSGTIPLLVYYGIHFINPTYIVLTAFLATAVMSLTGSSWASAGTIGVAFMGVAGAMNVPLAPVAGAVISGAYFGDKLSPLSDTTNICAIAARANLYDHIKNMMFTAIPSFVIAVIVYLSVGMSGTSNTAPLSAIDNQLLLQIEKIYTLHFASLLPALVVIIGTLKRMQAALVMAASSVVALIIGVTLQGFSVNNALLAAVSGFSTNMIPASMVTNDALNGLLNRGGIYSMANTLILVFIAFLLAGAMEVSGALNKLLHTMLKAARSVFGLVAATMASGATMISLTSHGGVTALIVGELFQDAYKEKELAPENLSRSLEDSVTLLDPIMPWTVSGLFMATTLGVSTLDYLPWAVFCLTGFFFSLLLAALYAITGFGLKAAHLTLKQTRD